MKAIVTEALLVRSVNYGESDVIATLLTEAEGKLGVLVRGARKSSRRVGGSLEPFHTIEVRLDDRGGDLATLREARITRVRAGIVGNLETLEAAGMALRWARHAWPARTREPETWTTLVGLLDALDAAGAEGHAPRIALASGSLRLLADLGYALDLERCVRCGKECPAGRTAGVDAARGGLICGACGGARIVLEPRVRALARAAQQDAQQDAQRDAQHDESGLAMTLADADVILGLVEGAMAAHAGFDR